MFKHRQGFHGPTSSILALSHLRPVPAYWPPDLNGARDDALHVDPGASRVWHSPNSTLLPIFGLQYGYFNVCAVATGCERGVRHPGLRCSDPNGRSSELRAYFEVEREPDGCRTRTMISLIRTPESQSKLCLLANKDLLSIAGRSWGEPVIIQSSLVSR